MDKDLMEQAVAETLGEDMPTNKQYPKYQISKFLDSKRDYQIVIRTDNFDELMSAMKKVKPLVEGVEKKAKDSGGDVYENKMNGGQKCKRCGANMVKNPKTGKWFCEEKCWLNK